jgi:hypothetical protein
MQIPNDKNEQDIFLLKSKLVADYIHVVHNTCSVIHTRQGKFFKDNLLRPCNNFIFPCHI